MSSFHCSSFCCSFIYFSHCAAAEEEDIGEEVSSFPFTFPYPFPFTSKDTMSLLEVVLSLISSDLAFSLLRLYASIRALLSSKGFITSINLGE